MTSHADSVTGNDAIRHREPHSGGPRAAVVAVRDGGHREERTGRSCWVAMEDYRRLLRERTAVRALAVPLTESRPHPVATRITELPENIAAVFLIGLGAAESASVQSITAAIGGRLVISETDTLTASMAAAAVTALRSKGIPPGRGRIAVNGADRAPRLAQVLLRCGAASVTTSRENTLHGPAIRTLMIDHDIVVDPTGRDSMWAVPGRTITVPADPFPYAALALPGLLGALCGHGTTRITIDALTAAARAIALITPIHRPLPDIRDHRLVTAVAGYVSRVLDGRPHARP